LPGTNVNPLFSLGLSKHPDIAMGVSQHSNSQFADVLPPKVICSFVDSLFGAPQQFSPGKTLIFIKDYKLTTAGLLLQVSVIRFKLLIIIGVRGGVMAASVVWKK
jgi:hypothetical protein